MRLRRLRKTCSPGVAAYARPERITCSRRSDRGPIPKHRSMSSVSACLSPNSTMPTSPRDVRDNPQRTVTSPLAQIPLRRLAGKFRGSRRNGIWVRGDVTGLSRTSRVSRHSGMWALQHRGADGGAPAKVEASAVTGSHHARPRRLHRSLLTLSFFDTCAGPVATETTRGPSPRAHPHPPRPRPCLPPPSSSPPPPPLRRGYF